jgi:hypothetical protein
MHPLTITCITLESTPYAERTFTATVTVTMDAKTWRKQRDRGALGVLYSVDISNAVYRMHPGIHATSPIVSDRKRAKAGLKTVELQYAVTAENAARFGCWPRYSDQGPSFIRLPVTRSGEPPALSLVR